MLEHHNEYAPKKADILAWISANPKQLDKRDIAKAFRLKGSERTALNQILKELESEGKFVGAQKEKDDREKMIGKFPPVSVLR